MRTVELAVWLDRCLNNNGALHIYKQTHEHEYANNELLGTIFLILTRVDSSITLHTLHTHFIRYSQWLKFNINNFLKIDFWGKGISIFKIKRTRFWKIVFANGFYSYYRQQTEWILSHFFFGSSKCFLSFHIIFLFLLTILRIGAHSSILYKEEHIKCVLFVLLSAIWVGQSVSPLGKNCLPSIKTDTLECQRVHNRKNPYRVDYGIIFH